MLRPILIPQIAFEFQFQETPTCYRGKFYSWTPLEAWCYVQWIATDPLLTNQRANILKEVQIMRQTNHENIIALKDFQESQDYYYLILERELLSF